MTRFARAKGSKSSNERIPNEATPWHVMKEQLVENLSKKEQYPGKVKTTKELLESKENTFDSSNDKNTNNWAEFEETAVKKSKPKESNNNKVKEKLSLKRKINEADNSITQVNIKKHKKEKNQSLDGNDTEIKDISHSVGENEVVNAKNNKINKKEKKNKHEPGKFVKAVVNNNGSSEVESNNMNNTTKKKEGVLSKRQKRNMRKKSIKSNDSTHNESENNVDSSIKEQEFKSKESNSFENNKYSGTTRNNYTTNKFNKKFGNVSSKFENGPNRFGTKKFESNKNNHRKSPKIRDDKEHKRRKPDMGPTKMMINGVEVEIVKFDSFPVKREDAERLSELRKKMIMKGIPKPEIDAAMKLERRKAEKALARLRRCVCFHCRKAGHNLSDCPELGSEQAGTGICFKCGSTEHTHFECKVAKPTEFRYATCFICREQGHIAKQCPDNPKGVYPQGGACKICGDVTHLKKDCPDLIKEKEETTVTVDTIANNNLESLEQNVKSTNEKANEKSKKIVKF